MKSDMEDWKTGEDIRQTRIKLKLRLSLLHGIAESERKNTDNLVLKILNEKMYVDLTFSDLERSYRIGQKKASSNKPRAVIIEFFSYNMRKRTFSNKKRLKGT